jgi:phage terminase large subunit GpA-like protein
VRWAELVAQYDASQDSPERRKTFVNLVLAETYSPPALEVPEAAALQQRAEPFQEGTAPTGGCFLTAGCDVQSDRLEIEVVSWGKDFESWSVAYCVLYGRIDQPDVWTQLDELLSRQWPHVSGVPLTLQAVAIDAGFSPAEVTAFTRHRHGQRIYACKGMSNGWGRPIWPRKASWDRNRHAIYMVSVDEAKSWTANRMRIETGGPGFIHVPLSRRADWFEQMTVEKLVFQKGQKRWLNPMRQRNESFDARCLAVCALHSRLLSGVDVNAYNDAFAAMLAPPEPAAARPNGAPAPPAKTYSRFVRGW